MSTRNLADNGIESTFGRTDVKIILGENRFLVGGGDRDQDSRIYMLPQPISKATPLLAMYLTESETNNLWHRRLAHINSRALPKLHEHVLDVPKLRELKNVFRACRLVKAHRLPFPGHFEDSKQVGAIVHSDIVGKLEPSFPDRLK